MPTPLSFAAQPSGGWSHPGGSAAGSAARAGPSKARPGLLEPGKVGAGQCARATPAEPRLRRKIVVATDKFLIPDRFLPGKLFCSLALLLALARFTSPSLPRLLSPSLLETGGPRATELRQIRPRRWLKGSTIVGLTQRTANGLTRRAETIRADSGRRFASDLAHWAGSVATDT